MDWREIHALVARGIAFDWSDAPPYIVAFVGLLTFWLAYRRFPSEQRKTQTDAEVSALAELRGVLAELRITRDELETSQDSEEDCRAKLDELRAELVIVRADLERSRERAKALENALPAYYLSERLTVLSDATKWVYDQSTDGIAIVLPDENGRLLWANLVFSAALGRTRENVLEMGWRALIHPEDRERAEEAELEAHSKGGTFIGRYLHADGSWVQMRFSFTPYEKGRSMFCIVHFRRRKADTNPPAAHGEA